MAANKKKGTIMVADCPHCHEEWEFTDEDIVILEPWPHYECPDCGCWIPAF